MLGGLVAAAGVGAVDVGIEIGIAHREVEQLDTAVAQCLAQSNRLGHVGIGRTIVAHAKAVGARIAVIQIHARGNQKIAAAKANRLGHCRAEQSRPVLKATAEFALAGVRAEQFAKQITVTALDISAVKAAFFSQQRALDQLLLHRFQIIIRYDAAVVDGVTCLQRRAMVGDQRRGLAFGLAVAPRVGQLGDDQRLVAVFLEAGRLNSLNQTSKIVCRIFVDVKLSGVGTALLQNGHRLRPHDACTSLGKAVVTAKRQLVGAAVGRAVTALHGLIGNAVGRNLVPHVQRRAQNVRFLCPRQRHIRLGAKRFVLLFIFWNIVCQDRKSVV